MDAITLKDVSFAYPRKPGAEQNGEHSGEHSGERNCECVNANKALDSVSFTVPVGSRTLLCGMTGSGKTTLLRLIKPELRQVGELSGSILLDSKPVDTLDPVESARTLGFVMQDPHQQIVMDNVRSELAFGMENLALESSGIHRRIAEIANFFGITSWLDSDTAKLSGGQKQIVNLAAVVAMQPQVLLLDEPTAQLDPIASKEFMALLARVNEELGITIVIIEHQLEEVLASSNQVLFLNNGFLAFDGSPRAFAQYLHATNHKFFAALPTATRLSLTHDAAADPVPLDIKEGRWWLYQHENLCGGTTLPPAGSIVAPTMPEQQTPSPATSAYKIPRSVIAAKNIWYRYARNTDYVLRELNIDIYAGQILGIVGGNGSGKSTLLNLLAGIYEPQHGKIKRATQLKLAALPQDPTALFLRDTLEEELLDYAQQFSYGQDEANEMLASFGLERYRRTHPFDLSGGEQQKAALAKLLLTGAQCLLLDEPTKGIDYFAKQEFACTLKNLKTQGKAVVVVSHDLEFIAQCADRCIMVFDGGLVGESATESFFANNMFYTTALMRLTHGLCDV